MSNSGIRAAMEAWRSGKLRGEIAVDVTSPAKEAVTAPYPSWLSTKVSDALSDHGVKSPYRHQVEAWNLLEGGSNIVVATPTASGKTLCYNVPVLHTLAVDPDATALYLFPTKALARDQEAVIRDLSRAANVSAAPLVYDGDTSVDERRTARNNSRILITNPDMLHVGILPHHASWARFFAGLRYVVVDELHQYRGVFGSHVANVIRRLMRVAGFHGSTPVFATCSATIGNPTELARNVIGGEFELICDSGAPTGPRQLVVYNPEVVDPILGTRRSALKTAARIAGDLVENRVATLVFCQTRLGVEMTLRYLRDRIKKKGGDPERVRGYRGGYLPTLRREIENALRHGELDAVVATNALELGIDVGELDAVVLAGYPGTIAATHQRSGRAGRRLAPSIAVMVARSNPIDQFLAREPSYLLESSPELALVQPDNVEILMDHLRCAAFEVPFTASESFGTISVDDTLAALDCLVEEGSLSRSLNRYYYIGSTYPAAEIGLRSVGGEAVVVMDMDSDEPLARVDPVAARLELHEHAIYQHEGRTYHVERFDNEAGRAYVRPVEPVYYTTPVVHHTLEVVEVAKRKALATGEVGSGDVRVTDEITGFKKLKFNTHENLGFGDVNLPPVLLETDGTWFTLGDSVPRPIRDLVQGDLMAGFEGLAHAVHQVASLRLMCDPRDISTVVQASNAADGEVSDVLVPAIYIYDAHSGGVGLSARAFEEARPMLEDALRLVTGCVCDTGCPSCCGPTIDDGPPVKQIARMIVVALLGHGGDR